MNQGLESKGCLKKTTRGSRCQGNKKSGSRFFKQPPDSKPSAARLGFGQLIKATRALNNGADNFCMQVAVIQKFVLTCKHRSAYSERPLRSMALYSSFRQKLQLFNINLSRIVTESGHFRNKDEIKPDEKRPTHPAHCDICPLRQSTHRENKNCGVFATFLRLGAHFHPRKAKTGRNETDLPALLHLNPWLESSEQSLIAKKLQKSRDFCFWTLGAASA